MWDRYFFRSKIFKKISIKNWKIKFLKIFKILIENRKKRRNRRERDQREVRRERDKRKKKTREEKRREKKREKKREERREKREDIYKREERREEREARREEREERRSAASSYLTQLGWKSDRSGKPWQKEQGSGDEKNKTESLGNDSMAGSSKPRAHWINRSGAKHSPSAFVF